MIGAVADAEHGLHGLVYKILHQHLVDDQAGINHPNKGFSTVNSILFLIQCDRDKVMLWRLQSTGVVKSRGGLDRFAHPRPEPPSRGGSVKCP